MRSCWWHDWTPWKSYAVRYKKTQLSHIGKLSLDVTETRQARRCNRCHCEQHVVIDNATGAMWDNIQNGHCPVSEDAVPDEMSEPVRPPTVN